jgi:hypothetical protein
LLHWVQDQQVLAAAPVHAQGARLVYNLCATCHLVANPVTRGMCQHLQVRNFLTGQESEANSLGHSAIYNRGFCLSWSVRIFESKVRSAVQSALADREWVSLGQQ